MSTFRPILLALAATGLAACDPMPSSDVPDGIALFGDGYPAAGDACRIAGETTLTAEYLDDAADLVACPPGIDAVATVGGEVVAFVEGWTLVSVPTR